MRKLAAILASYMIFTGCDALLESNLYQGIDAPPAVDNNAMLTVSVSTIKSELGQTLYNQLKNNTTALSNLQTNLGGVLTSGTAEEKVQAGQVMVQVTANSTAVLPVVNNVINAVLPLVSGSGSGLSNLGTDAASLQTTCQSLFDGLSTAQIVDTLNQLKTISDAMVVMATSATSSSDFFGDMNQGEAAQVGLVASVVATLFDTGADANTIAGLLTTSDPTTYVSTNFSGLDFSPLATAVTGGTNTTYNYISNLTSLLPI